MWQLVLSLLLCMQIWEFFLSLYIYIYSSFLFHFMTHSKLYDSSAISYDSSNYYPDNLILLTNIFTSLFIHFSRCWRTHTQHRFLWDFILSSMKTALLFLPFISYLLNSFFLTCDYILLTHSRLLSLRAKALKYPH